MSFEHAEVEVAWACHLSDWRLKSSDGVGEAAVEGAGCNTSPLNAMKLVERPLDVHMALVAMSLDTHHSLSVTLLSVWHFSVCDARSIAR